MPWFFFQDALNGGTNALIEYNYLVKKVVFKISILPIVKIISALFVHVFFVAFALILCACYGYTPSLYTLQIIYYSVCTFLFVLGLVYATSAIVIFFRDLTQIISIFLQVGVWLTPIMWDINMLSSHPWLIKLFKLNPMYYVVTGYREFHAWSYRDLEPCFMDDLFLGSYDPAFRTGICDIQTSEAAFCRCALIECGWRISA